MEIEKRTGHDWLIVFRDIEDDSLIAASLYGINTLEDAAAQAHADCGMPKDCAIVFIVRQGELSKALAHLDMGEN